MLSLTLARAPSRLAALHSRCSASAFLALRRRPKAACASPASGGGEARGRGGALISPFQFVERALVGVQQASRITPNAESSAARRPPCRRSAAAAASPGRLP